MKVGEAAAQLSATSIKVAPSLMGVTQPTKAICWTIVRDRLDAQGQVDAIQDDAQLSGPAPSASWKVWLAS